MTPTLNSLLVLVLVLNLFALGTSRILAVIRTVTMQGIIIGLLPLTVEGHADAATLLAVLVAVILKGIVIPQMLTKAMRDVHIKREIEPIIGFLPSMVLGALATGFALVFAAHLPLADAHAAPLLVPASLATMFVGFLMLITRIKAINQVIGYLILENGIFIFGMMLVEAMPLVVELAVLLDLFVGVFVICIIVNHINRAFSSLDTRRLVSLKE